ncbi:MAG: DUF2490 domain-containing protein [Acidobacteria bacterium]|nr:DUF2490 domain-containing protein [Acidobacteriota bacterium]
MTKYLTIIVILFAASVCAFSQEPNEGDIQVWNETKVYFKPFTKKNSAGKKEKFISPFIMGTIRIGRDVRHFVGERIGFGFDVQLNKYFKLTPSYYYIAEQPIKGSKAIEHRLRIEITGEKKWKKVSFSNRNRFERRLRFGRADSTRYRNKTKVAFPIKNSDGQEIVTPFVATEPFYDFSKKQWTRNEFSAGIGKKLSKSTSAEFFYMLQNNTGNTLKRVNIAGVNLKFTVN